MQKLKCELCGSIDIVKIEDDLFQCRHCGCKYTKEQAKALISGVVEVVKGTAELERRLKNAQTYMQLREYDKALGELTSLSNEYPAENIIYSKMLEYNYRLNKTMTVQRFHELAAIYRKAVTTAKSKADQEGITHAYNKFYTDFIKGLMAHQNTIEFIGFFREAFSSYKKNKTKPESIYGNALWNVIGTAVAAGIAAGKVMFEDSEKGKASLFDNQYPRIKHVLEYTDLDLIAGLHPKLKAVIEQGKQNAWEINHASMRLAYLNTYHDGYCHMFRSLQSGCPELEKLYVDVEFRLNDVTFASYEIHQHDGRSVQVPHDSIGCIGNPNNAFPDMQKIRLCSLSCCPFCGCHSNWLRLGLRKGKCKNCHGEIPRAVIASLDK